MARVSIDQLRRLVSLRAKAEADEDMLEPGVLYIDFPSLGEAPVIDQGLAGKCVSYEARSSTVVLDFDELGYLKWIEVS